MDIDTALDQAGGYRRWTMGIFFALGISTFTPLCFQGLSIVFTGWEPPHHCKLEEGWLKNETIPVVEDHTGEMGYAMCSMYTNDSIGLTGNVTRNTTTCNDGWDYEVAPGEVTIVNEWDLVCEKNYMSEMSQMIYQGGCLVGELVCSSLVDKFGRRHTHIWSNLALAAVGTGLAFSTSYLMFSIVRAINGVLIVLSLISGVTMMMEIFDSKRRTFAGIALEAQWLLLFFLLPLFAYLMRDWRHLQLFISLCSSVWIVYIWILPESPQWLMANEKYEEAEEALERMARYNGKKITVKLERVVRDPLLDEKNVGHSKFKASKDLNPLDLARDHVLRKHVFIASLLWFANNIVYYFLILNSPNMASNRFLSFFYSGLVEIPAYFSAFFVIKWFGRRRPLLVYHIIAGAALAPMVFVQTSSSNLTPLLTTLGLIAKFGISGSFAVIIVYTRELFPTNLRGTSGGITSVLGRLGNMFAPFAVYLNKTSLFWLPSILFSIISILSGFLVFTLPETGRIPLPQTLEDVHNLYADRSLSKTKSGELETYPLDSKDPATYPLDKNNEAIA